MHTLVLLRHGQSEWNQLGLFTGWTDVDLTEQGRNEAVEAGRVMAGEGIAPDVVHTSVLIRAIRTAEVCLAEMERHWIPVRRSWRLNERHYGALQGLDKRQTAAEHGDEMVRSWRRSYDVPPPPLAPTDERNARLDPRYRNLPPDVLPDTECLKDVVERMLPYWYDDIVPDLRAFGVVLVAAHGNSLRALVKHLDDISDDDIPSLNIPTGVPMLYELGEDYRPVSAKHPLERCLGDIEAVKAAAEAVARQAG